MKISTIVPVYNTEKYVGRCIDSIIAQTFSDWELILVDDGSSDGSPKILEDYKEKDSRIKVIHQMNAGPGLARNRGIENAAGEYIVFIDSDDVIKPDYFEKLSEETADVVFIDVDQVDENFNVIHKEHLSDFRNLSKDEFLRGQMTGKILWGGVRKAVKTQLLKKNGIKFTEHKVGEEALYSFLVLYYANSMEFISKTVYLYVNRIGSQSDTEDDDPWGPVVKRMKSKIKEMDIYERYAETINAFLLSALIVSLDKMAKQCKYCDFLKKAKKRIEEYKDLHDYEKKIDFKSIDNKVIYTYPIIKMKMLSVFYGISQLYRHIRNINSKSL